MSARHADQCWNIINCGKKSSCEMVKTRGRYCWEQAQEDDTISFPICHDCLVYKVQNKAIPFTEKRDEILEERGFQIAQQPQRQLQSFVAPYRPLEPCMASGVGATSAFERFDFDISKLIGRYFQPLIRICLAMIFIWFGLLKPMGLSPDEELIKQSVYCFEPSLVLNTLGVWEVVIGLGLLFRPLLPLSLLLLLLELPGTFMPLLILPDVCFHTIPFGLTLDGQIIIKNLILISTALVIGSKTLNQNDKKELLL